MKNGKTTLTIGIAMLSLASIAYSNINEVRLNAKAAVFAGAEPGEPGDPSDATKPASCYDTKVAADRCDRTRTNDVVQSRVQRSCSAANSIVPVTGGGSVTPESMSKFLASMDWGCTVGTFPSVETVTGTVGKTKKPTLLNYGCANPVIYYCRITGTSGYTAVVMGAREIPSYDAGIRSKISPYPCGYFSRVAKADGDDCPKEKNEE